MNRKLPHQSRRELLTRIGGAALALPLLECLEPRRARAAAPGKIARNLVLFYVPNGMDHPPFWPTGGERDFKLGPALQPLAPHRDKLIIAGPQFPSAADRMPTLNTGLTYEVRPQTHQSHVATTGDTQKFPYDPQTGDGTTNKAAGPSIDQLVASALPVKTRFRSLELGIHPVGGDTPSTINFAMDGTPLPRMTDSAAAWKRVFEGIMDSGGAAGPAGAARPPDQRRTAVSSFLHRRFAAIAPRLGRGDRQLLERHQQALRETEERLFASATAPAAGCNVSGTKLQAPATGSPYADVPALTENFEDIIALALACDLTRVASLSLGYPGGGGNGGIRPTWLGFDDAHHGLSHHGGNAGKRDKFNKYTTWVVGQVERLLKRLESFASPGGGTLLDDTLVFFFFRHSDGNVHGNSNLPWIIAGGAGGYFGPMGRFLTLPKTNPNQFLISIANAMGVEVDGFGHGKSRATAPLGALMA